MQCLNPECKIDSYQSESLFGDDWTCPVCGSVHETDWDYSDAMEGVIAQWTSELISIPVKEAK